MPVEVEIIEPVRVEPVFTLFTFSTVLVAPVEVFPVVVLVFAMFAYSSGFAISARQDAILNTSHLLAEFDGANVGAFRTHPVMYAFLIYVPRSPIFEISVKLGFAVVIED